MSMQPWEEAYESSRDADRLRKENEQLQRAIDSLNKETGEAMAAMNAEIVKLRLANKQSMAQADHRSAENVKLRQENERLRAALREVKGRADDIEELDEQDQMIILVVISTIAGNALEQ